MTVAQVAIGLLRQSLLPTARVHGFVTHGGEAPNIIPAHTSARYIVRGWTLAELEDVRAKVLRCFEAGAVATGATLEIVGGMAPYAEVRHDPDLVARYQANAEALGRTFGDLGLVRTRGSGSTDMGNVSHVVPIIHPFIRIETDGAVNHQPEFTAAAATASGDQAVIDGAIAMAWTAIDAATEPDAPSPTPPPRLARLRIVADAHVEDGVASVDDPRSTTQARRMTRRATRARSDHAAGAEAAGRRQPSGSIRRSSGSTRSGGQASRHRSKRPIGVQRGQLVRGSPSGGRGSGRRRPRPAARPPAPAGSVPARKMQRKPTS